MHHHSPYAARAANKTYGRTHPHAISFYRAPVNVYKTESSYEMLVFAPGRVKENFNVSIDAAEIVIRYQPGGDIPTPEWVHKEYSRGAFERRFQLDESVDIAAISARYEDGVLKITLPIKPGSLVPKQAIPVG